MSKKRLNLQANFFTSPSVLEEQFSNFIVRDVLQPHPQTFVCGWPVSRRVREAQFCEAGNCLGNAGRFSVTYTGTPLEQYFYTASVSKRGHIWLKPNGRGQVANDQYLDAVDQVMSRVLINQRDKMFNGSP